eukprot:4214692-Karenia_brevis.AAC.1
MPCTLLHALHAFCTLCLDRSHVLRAAATSIAIFASLPACLPQWSSTSLASQATGSKCATLR